MTPMFEAVLAKVSRTLSSADKSVIETIRFSTRRDERWCRHSGNAEFSEQKQ
jgi:hypothetical protein